MTPITSNSGRDTAQKEDAMSSPPDVVGPAGGSPAASVAGSAAPTDHAAYNLAAGNATNVSDLSDAEFERMLDEMFGPQDAYCQSDGYPDRDERRHHELWDSLQQDRQRVLDTLLALAARWDQVPIQHELELAAFVSDVWRTLEELLADHALTMMGVVSTVVDEATPDERTPLSEDLRDSAHRTVREAWLEAREVGSLGPDVAWYHAGEALFETVHQFVDGLRRLAAGEEMEQVIVSNANHVARDPRWIRCPVCGGPRSPIPGPPIRLTLLP